MKRFSDHAFFMMFVLALAGCIPASSENNMAPATPPIATPATAPAPLPLLDTVWAWQYTQQIETRTASPAPTRYTLLFRNDGRLAVTADCNRGGTAYHLKGETLTLEPIAMTKMGCPQDSLDRIFLNNLRAVERFHVDHQALTLELSQGARMVFTPSAP